MFSLIISEHKLWGYLFVPTIISDVENKFYNIVEILNEESKNKYTLNYDELTVLDLCKKYSDSYLLKIFGVRNELQIDFYKRCEHDEKLCLKVKSFIQNYNFKIAQYIKNKNISIFIRENLKKIIYKENAVLGVNTDIKVVPTFIRTSENLKYFLRLYNSENKQIKLYNSNFIILSNNPCCIVLFNDIYISESVDASKLIPFTKKQYIEVPKQTEDSYMRSFVLKLLKKENIETDGFSVIKSKPNLKPQIILIHDLGNDIAVNLLYKYDEKILSLEDTNMRQVSLSDDGLYTFYLFERDIEQEKKYFEKLKSIGFSYYNYNFYLKKGANQYDFIEFLSQNMESLCEYEIIQDLGNENLYCLEKASIDLSINKNDIDWFNLHGIINIGRFHIPFCKIKKNILTQNREFVLPDKTIAILPEEWFYKYSDIFKLSSETADGDIILKTSQIGLIDEIEIHGKEKIVDLSNFNDKYDIPNGVNATLRPYQHIGFSWLVALYNNNFGGCLADDMGLGKTLQFLTFFQFIYPKNKVQQVNNQQIKCKKDWPYANKQSSIFDLVNMNQEDTHNDFSYEETSEKKPASLIVLPTSLLHNWESEKCKFTPTLSSYLYFGNKRTLIKDINRFFSNYNLIFTTYGTLRNDSNILSNYTFECVVLDESQNIKNPSSLLYKAVMELKAKRYYSITGTPIENSLIDLWTQMNFVNRDILGNISYFKNHYENPIIKGKNEERETKLKKIIQPFILRRTKNEVAKDLPPKTEQIILCQMTEEHKKIYERENSFCRNTILSLNTESNDTIIAIQALMRLRQISNHPSLVFEDYKGESSKLELVISNLENLKKEGHKVLVFSSFVRHLEFVEKRLIDLQIKYSKLTGSTHNREEQIELFQNDKDVSCFLISIKAGGVGLNLTAADYVFILDPWWNPATENQATDRAHRIGQTKPTFIYRFIMANTIEEKIQQLQNEKRILASNYINNNNPFENISIELLKEIVK